MADMTSMMGKIANRLGINLSRGQDSGLKTEAKTSPLASILGGENLILTEGAPNKQLGELINEKLAEMINSGTGDTRALMAILKSMADVSMTIAENMKPNEELQEELKERREKLQELQDRLEEDDKNYAEVLAAFKEIFIDTQTDSLLEKRTAEEHPIQA